MSSDRPADYLVVGAGAAGLAFTDALVEHSDAHVVLIDRHPGPGGHWREAYPFVRLHQASWFYGVASMPLGSGRVQTEGPETGLHERATGEEVLGYFERVLGHLGTTGQVDFHGKSTWTGSASFVTTDGREHSVPPDCRIVDATYRAANIPATTPPPFAVAPGVRIVPVNELVRIGTQAPQYVIIGAGKTATDTCIWLLHQGVAPDAICWVMPRDPWMFNRAHVQPNPTTIFGMVATTWEAAAASSSAEDLFLRLEDSGIMLRIDPAVSPTMAKTPTLATWELDLLRSIPEVVRHGHLTGVSPGVLQFGHTRVPIHRDAVVVHCAASGHAYPPLVPIWADLVRLQTIRAGFPCFNAALAGYVEATRTDDAVKNRLCPPCPLPDTLATWSLMQVLGARATAAFMAEPDIAAWAQSTVLNPARIPPGQQNQSEVVSAIERIKRHAPAAMAKLSSYAR